MEKLARTLFLWKIEVHEQKERVYEMRRWNEALVTNMLPEHVARHFLGSKKRDEVRSGLVLCVPWSHGAVSSSGFLPGSACEPRPSRDAASGPATNIVSGPHLSVSPIPADETLARAYLSVSVILVNRTVLRPYFPTPLYPFSKLRLLQGLEKLVCIYSVGDENYSLNNSKLG